MKLALRASLAGGRLDDVPCFRRSVRREAIEVGGDPTEHFNHRRVKPRFLTDLRVKLGRFRDERDGAAAAGTERNSPAWPPNPSTIASNRSWVMLAPR